MSKPSTALSRSAAHECPESEDSVSAPRRVVKRTISGTQVKQVKVSALNVPVLTVPEAEEEDAPSMHTPVMLPSPAAAVAFEHTDHEFWSEGSGHLVADRPSSLLPPLMTPRPRPSLMRSMLTKVLFLLLFGGVLALLGHESTVLYEKDAFGIRTLFGPFQEP